MSILQQGGEAHQPLPEFDELRQIFLKGLSSLSAGFGLKKEEVENIGWLAWVDAREKGKGPGWWWAATRQESKKASVWWGPQGAPKISIELLEFELAAPEKFEIERWRGPEGDLFCELNPEKLAKELGVSPRRAQQKIKAATDAAAAPQADLFLSGVEK